MSVFLFSLDLCDPHEEIFRVFYVKIIRTMTLSRATSRDELTTRNELYLFVCVRFDSDGEQALVFVFRFSVDSYDFHEEIFYVSYIKIICVMTLSNYFTI